MGHRCFDVQDCQPVESGPDPLQKQISFHRIVRWVSGSHDQAGLESVCSCWVHVLFDPCQTDMGFAAVRHPSVCSFETHAALRVPGFGADHDRWTFDDDVIGSSSCPLHIASIAEHVLEDSFLGCGVDRSASLFVRSCVGQNHFKIQASDFKFFANIGRVASRFPCSYCSAHRRHFSVVHTTCTTCGARSRGCSGAKCCACCSRSTQALGWPFA